MSIPKMWINKLVKISKFLLIPILIFSWIFSGWPPIWQNSQIPPKIQEAQAASTITRIQAITLFSNVDSIDVGTALGNGLIINTADVDKNENIKQAIGGII